MLLVLNIVSNGSTGPQKREKEMEKRMGTFLTQCVCVGGRPRARWSENGSFFPKKGSKNVSPLECIFFNRKGRAPPLDLPLFLHCQIHRWQ